MLFNIRKKIFGTNIKRNDCFHSKNGIYYLKKAWICAYFLKSKIVSQSLTLIICNTFTAVQLILHY